MLFFFFFCATPFCHAAAAVSPDIFDTPRYAAADAIFAMPPLRHSRFRQPARHAFRFRRQIFERFSRQLIAADCRFSPLLMQLLFAIAAGSVCAAGARENAAQRADAAACRFATMRS